MDGDLSRYAVLASSETRSCRYQLDFIRWSRLAANLAEPNPETRLKRIPRTQLSGHAKHSVRIKLIHRSTNRQIIKRTIRRQTIDIVRSTDLILLTSVADDRLTGDFLETLS